MIFIKALVHSGTVQRSYELPIPPSDCDRIAFIGWLLDVLPTADQLPQAGHARLWKEEWPDA